MAATEAHEHRFVALAAVRDTGRMDVAETLAGYPALHVDERPVLDTTHHADLKRVGRCGPGVGIEG